MYSPCLPHLVQKVSFFTAVIRTEICSPTHGMVKPEGTGTHATITLARIAQPNESSKPASTTLQEQCAHTREHRATHTRNCSTNRPNSTEPHLPYPVHPPTPPIPPNPLNTPTQPLTNPNYPCASHTTQFLAWASVQSQV